MAIYDLICSKITEIENFSNCNSFPIMVVAFTDLRKFPENFGD